MSKKRKQKCNMRKAARRGLAKMVDEQDGKCFYCGQFIICRSQVDWEKVSGSTYAAVTMQVVGEEVKIRWASVEHVRPLKDGGSNKKANLVAACVLCNLRRNRQPKAITT